MPRQVNVDSHIHVGLTLGKYLYETELGDSDIATRLIGSVNEVFFHFTSAQLADSESKWRYRDSSNERNLNAGGVYVFGYVRVYVTSLTFANTHVVCDPKHLGRLRRKASIEV